MKCNHEFRMFKFKEAIDSGYNTFYCVKCLLYVKKKSQKLSEMTEEIKDGK